MRLIQRALAALLALALAAAPAFAADNITVKDASAATVTMRSKDVGAGIQAPTNTVANSSGTLIDPATSGNQTSELTKLDTLHTDMVAATPAGENHVGEVGGHSMFAAATFTTPAGTTAYTSGDLIANSATAGSVTPLSFTVCRVNTGTGMVRRARFKTNESGLTGKLVTLKLYRDSPTVTNGDNGAWLSTESNYLGSITVTADQTFSDPLYKGIGVPAVGGEINFDCNSGTQTIFGLEVAGEASATLVGAKTHTWVLEVLAN
jgi:hypothetical protein